MDCVAAALLPYVLASGADAVSIPFQTAAEVISARLGLQRQFVTLCMDQYFALNRYRECDVAASVRNVQVSVADDVISVAQFVWAQHETFSAGNHSLLSPFWTTAAPRQQVVQPQQLSSTIVARPLQQPCNEHSTFESAQWLGSDNFAPVASFAVAYQNVGAPTAASNTSALASVGTIDCWANLPPEVERKICKQYRRFGVCSFGSRCLYHHSVQSALRAIAKAESSQREQLSVQSNKRPRTAFADISNANNQ